MTRLLEFIVALILVFVAAVVVGLLLPSHGHVQRSVEISHNVHQTYDIINNFRRFDGYSALTSLDPRTQYTFSGPAYGVGAEVAWQTDAKIGDGALTIKSNEMDRQVVWALDNDWHGSSKHYTVTLDPSDDLKLVKITMAYDVDYGWDLISRYSQLYLHGHPASFMQYTLDNMQNVLAHIPNIGYKDLEPVLVDTQRRPVLMVSTKSPRTLDDIAVATHRALDKIHAAMKQLGVTQAGPYVTLTTNWGSDSYAFDIAVPISSTKLHFGDKVVDLLAPSEPVPATPSSTEASAAADGLAADAGAAPAGPGTLDSDGTIRVNDDVIAEMAFKGRALMATLNNSSPATLPLIRLGLKAYAATHGYDFNEFAFPLYDVDVSAPDNDTADARNYRVYLPVSGAPEKTPWQIKHPEQARQMIAGTAPDAAGEQAGEATEPAKAASAAE